MMINDKKKKRGLFSMAEKMGLSEGSDYVTPSKNGILPTASNSGNETDSKQSVGSKIRDRMTGRA